MKSVKKPKAEERQLWRLPIEKNMEMTRDKQERKKGQKGKRKQKERLNVHVKKNGK